jgi:hypothetical protein
VTLGQSFPPAAMLRISLADAQPATCWTWSAESWNVLAAPLVSEWNDLPTDVQRRLFEHATSGKSRDADLLKTRIARFLHDHKDALDSS